MLKATRVALLFLAVFFNPFFMEAQECGTIPTAEQIEHLSHDIEERMFFTGMQERSSGIRWIPVQFHECVHSPGSIPVIDKWHLDPMMNQLNQIFLPYDIQFFECGPINVFANSSLNSFDISEEVFLTPYEIPNVINVYFFAGVTSASGPLCGYSYLPPSADRVVMSKSCLSMNIFLHEMGHYLGLYHTHGKSNSVRTDELVNGSNCTIAGDDVCDTPADPNVFRSAGFMSGCTYIGQMTDANGDLYAPDPTNIMSYANEQCWTGFTTQQKNRMAYTALNDRANLTGCQHPNACSTPITTLPYHADFENGLADWSNADMGSTPTTPFLIGSGPTPTPGTGPDAAFSGNNYVFVEANTALTDNRLSLLRSPCFDLRGYNSPKVSFRYHSFGSSIYDYGIALSTDGGYDWYGTMGEQILHYATDNNNSQWNQVVCDLSAFKTARYFQLGIFTTLNVDSLGDFAIDSIRIFDDSACNLAVSGSVLQPTCTGLNNGSIALSVSGGNATNLSYNWSTGSTSGIVTGLAPGIYSVTVTGSAGCSNVQTFNIIAPLPLVVNGTATHSGAANGGSVSITVSGGTSPYYYNWSNGATTSNLSGVTAGTYTLTVTDFKDCSTVRTYTIVQPVVCSTYYSTFPWTGSFEQNFGIFEIVYGYSTNWVRRTGATPNQNTGPNQAYHQNRYAHINSANAPRTAVLRTKDCLNLTAVNNPVIEFYYHLFGAQMGTLYVEVSTDNGATWTTAWSLSGNQGNQWTKASVSLQPYNNGATRIRFRGETSYNTSDMAIDAVYIGPAGSNQLLPLDTWNEAPTLTVAPNPSQGIFNLEMTTDAAFEHFEVYNAAGRMILNQPISQRNTVVDLSAQPVGVYYLRAFRGEAIEIKKIVITRY
jgi:MAM domain, meprin/A5/mu/Secretion system C-terminal sorting domain/SprB repeat